jgi:hypothetical protein
MKLLVTWLIAMTPARARRQDLYRQGSNLGLREVTAAAPPPIEDV